MEREIRVKKEDVLNCLKEIELWREVTPDCLIEVFTQLFPEVFEQEKKDSGLTHERLYNEPSENIWDEQFKEKKEPVKHEPLEESKLDKLVHLYDSEYVTSDQLKREIIALAIKKVDECRRVPAQSIILFDEAKQRLGEM